jgi:pimeloyl-ACP methyl ester carboxylesterase
MIKQVLGFLKKLVHDFTVYYIRRRPGLPEGYSLKDMSDDYAVMVEDEIGGPVDIMGISTGGTIAQHFAADHPGLVNRLVLAMAGYRMTEKGKKLLWEIAELGQQGKWRTAAALMSTSMSSGCLIKLLFWLMGKSSFGSPDSPSDGIIEIKAEVSYNFKKRLAEIKSPTLVIGGDKDFFYPIRETAEGIHGAKLILYEGAGHSAMMKRRFGEDILGFLIEDTLHIN